MLVISDGEESIEETKQPVAERNREDTHTHTLPCLVLPSHYPSGSRGPPQHEEAKTRGHIGGLHLLWWTARPPALFIHSWQCSHCTAPRCSEMGFALSDKRLCRFRSPGLLKLLLQSLHITGCSVTRLVWEGGLLILHLCTANPPALWNQHSQLKHWTAPGTFWFGDITSRTTRLSSSSPLCVLDPVLSVSVKNDVDLITVVPSFGDHRCQDNSKVMECLNRRIKLL